MLLLDTHVLLWFRTADRKLGVRALSAIAQASLEGGLAVSTMVFWETGMLLDKGRVNFPQDVELWRRELLAEGVVEIPIDGVIAARAGLLPNIHGDPADRIIVATALNGHTLITSDRRILEWPGQVDRLDARR